MPIYWQDIVFGIGQAAFLGALVPALGEREKPPLITSLLTGGVLIAFAVTYWTMGYLWAMSCSGATAIAWLLLAWQRGFR